MNRITACQTTTVGTPAGRRVIYDAREEPLPSGRRRGLTMAQTAARTFLNELDAAGVQYELIPHAHTETAVAEAEAVGVEPAHVAKTIILVTRTGFVRAVLP